MVIRRLAENRFNRRDLEREAVFQFDRLLGLPGRKNDIMSGLVPIGDTGLYGTPATPADPTDCARYPDSIYCGGNPLSIRSLAVDFQIIKDGCNVGIRLNPILAFIRLPPVAIVYRSPECRNPPPQPKFEPPEGDYSSPVQIPANACSGLGNTVVVVVPTYLRSHEEGFAYASGEHGKSDLIINYTASVESPYNGDYFISETFGSGSSSYVVQTKPRSKITITLNQTWSRNKTYLKSYHPNIYYSLPGPNTIESDNEYFHETTDTRTVITYTLPSEDEQTIEPGGYIWQDRYLTAINALSTLNNSSTTTFSEDGSDYSIKTVERQYQVYVKCGVDIAPPLPPLPPLPTNDPMICCPTTYANNALLKKILEKVEKLSEIVGVEEFPAKMPKRLIYPSGQGDVEVKSVVQALGYQIKQIDKAVGYLPQKIKVADVNAAQPGNQSVEVDIHSFADFARETLQYLIDTEGDEDTLTNIAVRILYECGAIHQTSVQGAAMLDCIVEFLDFKEKWKTVKVPFAFDPYAGQKGKKAGRGFGKDTDQKGKLIPLTEEELEKMLPAFLKETEVEIRILENEQSKSLNDTLQEILKDARIAAAGVSDAATGERLEQLVNAAQSILQLQNAIDRNNIRKGLTSGDLRTRKKQK